MLAGGAGNAYADLLAQLGRMGGKVEWAKVSRVDLCVDQPNQPLLPFYTLTCQQHNPRLSKAKSRHLAERTHSHGQTASPAGRVDCQIKLTRA
jgi:hypothetical protein